MDRPALVGSRLIRCPLVALDVVDPLAPYQRAKALVPIGAKILHLGSTPPNDDVFLYVLARDALDEKGIPRSFKPEEMFEVEFIMCVPGHLIPDHYVLRAPVRAPQGLLFFFQKQEKETGLFLPRGAKI